LVRRKRSRVRSVNPRKPNRSTTRSGWGSGTLAWIAISYSWRPLWSIEGRHLSKPLPFLFLRDDNHVGLDCVADDVAVHDGEQPDRGGDHFAGPAQKDRRERAMMLVTKTGRNENDSIVPLRARVTSLVLAESGRPGRPGSLETQG